MELKLEDMVEKYNNCVKNIDNSKTCSTCKHNEKDQKQEPCNTCFSELLGFPVDPTSWIIKQGE